LYQELYVSDLKRDIETVETQVQVHKERYAEARMGADELRKENS